MATVTAQTGRPRLERVEEVAQGDTADRMQTLALPSRSLRVMQDGPYAKKMVM